MSGLSHDAESSDNHQRIIAIKPAIYLEYGLDGACLEDTFCEVCERGMRFRSQWRFNLHSLLHIAFSLEENGASQRIEAEGVVVESTPAAEGGGYCTTLAFLERPKELRSQLGKVSARLILPPSGQSSC